MVYEQVGHKGGPFAQKSQRTSKRVFNGGPFAYKPWFMSKGSSLNVPLTNLSFTASMFSRGTCGVDTAVVMTTPPVGELQSDQAEEEGWGRLPTIDVKSETRCLSSKPSTTISQGSFLSTSLEWIWEKRGRRGGDCCCSLSNCASFKPRLMAASRRVSSKVDLFRPLMNSTTGCTDFSPNHFVHDAVYSVTYWETSSVFPTPDGPVTKTRGTPLWLPLSNALILLEMLSTSLDRWIVQWPTVGSDPTILGGFFFLYFFTSSMATLRPSTMAQRVRENLV